MPFLGLVNIRHFTPGGTIVAVMSRLSTIFAILPGLMMYSPGQANDSINIAIGKFSGSSLDGWKEKSFSGSTNYRFVTTDGKVVLLAESNGAASGLFYEKEIDLLKTPVINWSWKVDKVLKDAKETTKKGDDYPARVYVIFSGGIFFWRTRAINYVWSNNQKIGTTWPNAYTGNAQMIAVRTGGDQAGQWMKEKRNIREDYKQLFGEDIDSADAIAIMTDTDNTGGHAVAYYGDIYLTSH